jgi:hypothetical protein
LSAKTTNHGLQRRHLETEPLADAVQWFAGHDDRTDRFVLPLESLLGFKKELKGRAIIHDAGSSRLIILLPQRSA